MDYLKMFRKFFVISLFLFSTPSHTVVGSGLELVKNDGSLAQQWVVAWQGLVNLGWGEGQATHFTQRLDNAGRLQFLQQNRHLSGITLLQPEELRHHAEAAALQRIQGEEQRRRIEERLLGRQQPPASVYEDPRGMAAAEDPEDRVLQAVLEASRRTAEEEERRRAEADAAEEDMDMDPDLAAAIRASLEEKRDANGRTVIKYANQMARERETSVQTERGKIEVLHKIGILLTLRTKPAANSVDPSVEIDTLCRNFEQTLSDREREAFRQEVLDLKKGSEKPTDQMALGAVRSLLFDCNGKSRINEESFKERLAEARRRIKGSLSVTFKKFSSPVHLNTAAINEYLWQECLKDGQFNCHLWEELKRLRGYDDIQIINVGEIGNFERYIPLQQERALKTEQDAALQESLRADRERELQRQAAAAIPQAQAESEDSQEEPNIQDLRRLRVTRFQQNPKNPDDSTAL